MRIIQFITRGDEYYGAQKHVHILSKRLKENGHCVLVVVGSHGELTKKLEIDKIDFKILTALTRSINLLNDFKAFIQYKEIITNFKPDIIASHSAKAGAISRVFRIFKNIPLVFTAHGLSFSMSEKKKVNFKYLLAEKFFALFTDSIITVSKSDEEKILKYKICKNKKVHTIYYGIENLDNKQQLVFPANNNKTINFLMVAGFRKQKDHITLLNAFAKLKYSNWKLTLIGDGPEKKSIEALVKKLRIENKIDLIGYIPNENMHNEYLAAHVLLLITFWEGLPISIIEGLSYGLPIIATNVDGIAEQIIDNYNGFLVPKGDSDELNKRLNFLVEHKEILENFGMNSFNLFKKQYSVEKMIKATIRVYEDQLNKCIV